MDTEKPPQIEKIANNKPVVAAPEDEKSMAYRYKRAYEHKLKNAPKDILGRIKENRDGDRIVAEFIREVAALAESDKEL